MPSSPTSSLRLEKQADGENTNLWGDKLDQALDKLDAAVAGWLTKALTGNYALTTANYAADEASVAMLKFTGTGAFTVTVPSVSKAYRVWNACTGPLTVTNGSSSTTVQPGEVVDVITDGGANFARVQPTDYGGARLTSVGAGVNAGDAVNYSQMNTAISTAVFTQTSFGVPILPGSSGQFLTNNGATPSWGDLASRQDQSIAALTAGRYSSVYGGAAINAKDTSGGANHPTFLSFQLNGTEAFRATTNGLTFLTGRCLSDVAVGADIRAGTSATKANTPKALTDSAAFVALADAATVLSDVGTQGYNLKLTLTASGHTIAGPTWNGGTPYDGCPLLLAITAATFTCSWSTSAGGFDFGLSGTPVLSSGAGKIDFLSAVWSNDLGKWRVLGVARSA